MTNLFQSPARTAAFLLLPLISAFPLRAGGTLRIDTHTRMPVMGMMTTEGDTTEWVNGQMKRTDADMKVEGEYAAFARMGGLGGVTITIIRLDKGVVWRLKPEDREYTETPIQALEKSPEYPSARRAGHGGGVKITDAGMTVTATGEKRVINLWPCTLYKLDGFIEFEETEKHRKFRWLMKTDLWNTPDMPLLKRYHDAESEFSRNYLAKQGVTIGSGAMSRMGFESLARMAGATGAELTGALAKMGTEMQKVSGVTILTHYVWKMEGGDAEPERKSRGAAARNFQMEGETEIKAIKDEDGSFDIPAGYKKKD